MKTRVACLAAVAAIVLATLTVGTGTAGAGVIEIGTGHLRVTTSPAVASQVSVDGEWSNTWAVNELELSPGNHEVCFSDVPGYTTPDCGIVEIVPDLTAHVEATFVQRGWLQVVTDPPVPGLVTVDGAPANAWGVFTDVAVGSHQVCFGPVEGFSTPDCESVTVTAGATSTVTGSYTAGGSGAGLDGVGLLRVETVPAVASRISVDGVEADTWGLDWMPIGPGSHEVCFGDVAGFSTPDCESVTVVEGATAEVTGEFTPQGYLAVSTDPGLPARIEVDGVGRDGWGLWTAVDVGTHQVCFSDVAGFVTPECETVTVTAGTTTAFTGTYEPPATVGVWTELRTPDGTGSWIPQDTNRNGLVVGEGYWCKNPCATSSALVPPPGVDTSTLGYEAVDDSDAIVGYGLDPDGLILDAYVWTSPTAAGRHVTLPGGWTTRNVDVVAPDGSLIGSGLEPGDSRHTLLFWSSPEAEPGSLTVPAGWNDAFAMAWSSNGHVTGYGHYGGRFHGAMFSVTDGAVTPLADVDPSTAPDGAIGTMVTDDGFVLGFIMNPDQTLTRPVVWADPDAEPVVLDLPAGYRVAPNYVQIGAGDLITAIAFDAADQPHLLAWTSPTGPATELATPPGTALTDTVLTTDDSAIITNVNGAGGSVALVYPTPGATPGVLAGPDGYDNVLTFGISTDGAIYAQARNSSGDTMIVIWPDLDAEPLVADEPTGWQNVVPVIPTPGGPVIATGTDGGVPVGLVFSL